MSRSRDLARKAFDGAEKHLKKLVREAVTWPVQAIYRLVDELIEHKREEQAAAGEPVTCPKGDGGACWHCCTPTFPITAPELAYVQEVISEDAWDRVLAAWWLEDTEKASRMPCPLLDPESKRCTVYERRPLVCRGWMVTSPVSGCAPDVQQGTRVVSHELMEISLELAERYGRPANFNQALALLARTRHTQGAKP